MALLGFLGWVFPRNPGSNPTATLLQNNAPSNHPSSLGEATAPGSTTRLGQARGPEPVRKIDDEIARILQGDFITNIYTLSSNETLVEVGKLPRSSESLVPRNSRDWPKQPVRKNSRQILSRRNIWKSLKSIPLPVRVG